jgi:hypothetical protein
MRRLPIPILVLALAGCPPPRPPDEPVAQFWSLVKVTKGDQSYAFKCLQAQEPGSIRVKCFSPVEIPLFDIAIEGHAVVTEAASEVVASKIPFGIDRIGTDVWRAHAATTKEDILSYNLANDPDLPEDDVVVERDAEGRPTSKTFLAGGEPVVQVSFTQYAGGRAGRIVLESLDPVYTLEVVQGGTGG